VTCPQVTLGSIVKVRIAISTLIFVFFVNHSFYALSIILYMHIDINVSEASVAMRVQRIRDFRDNSAI